MSSVDKKPLSLPAITEVDEKKRQRRERIAYVLTFVFGLATILALSLAIVQIVRSIQLDQVLIDQTKRLARIDQFLLDRFGDE